MAAVSVIFRSAAGADFNVSAAGCAGSAAVTAGSGCCGPGSTTVAGGWGGFSEFGMVAPADCSRRRRKVSRIGRGAALILSVQILFLPATASGFDPPASCRPMRYHECAGLRYDLRSAGPQERWTPQANNVARSWGRCGGLTKKISLSPTPTFDAFASPATSCTKTSSPSYKPNRRQSNDISVTIESMTWPGFNVWCACLRAVRVSTRARAFRVFVCACV